MRETLGSMTHFYSIALPTFPIFDREMMWELDFHASIFSPPNGSAIFYAWTKTGGFHLKWLEKLYWSRDRAFLSSQ